MEPIDEINKSTRLIVYNGTGELINQILPNITAKQEMDFTWFGKDKSGITVVPGIFFPIHVEKKSVVLKVLKF